MINIQESIHSIDGSRIAFINKFSKYTYAELRNLANINQSVLHALKGTNLVIKGKERLEFILLLSLLDGIASRILFLPEEIDSELYQSYYDEVSTQYEVYMEGELLKYINVDSTNIENFHSDKDITTQWIIPTSGTTNKPKLISHSFKTLTKSTKSNTEEGEKYIWGLVFDIYRFSGIQVFLQSILAGSTLIITNPHDNISDISTLLSKNKCNALSATPSFWRKLLMTKGVKDLSFTRITLGGEISDKNILTALQQNFPLAKISHIYASTEVGVGFSVTDVKEGFPSSYLNGALPGIKMKIDKSNVLWISPKEKEQKYMSKDKMYDAEGYINTGDLVKIDNDRVYFLGRDSGAINVGGNKVQPEEIEAILLSTNFISAAYVYPLKNAMMGALVCADVVPLNKDADKKELKKAILGHCREKLESFKVPAIIKFVKELETTQSGKLKRKTI